MPSLKSLRSRINSVKSTRKITQAMKMVAAAKLRRAQAQAEAARPYAERMERMLASLGQAVAGSPDAPKLLVGTGADKVHLLVVVTADRGLAGPFNTNVGRFARARIRELEAQGKTVKILTVGRKGAAYLKREFANRFVGEIIFAGKKRIGFEDAQEIATRITEMLDAGEFDVCALVYNRFKSVISQIATEQRLIPAPMPEATAAAATTGPAALYEYEPAEEEILAALLPQNLAIQVYRALLESAAGEQGSRMTAMDNATRNAGEMINKLTLNYNRTRQANITKELIEIISGAEAV
jgi:F-type H+-transporting ATPase subunit gamma